MGLSIEGKLPDSLGRDEQVEADMTVPARPRRAALQWNRCDNLEEGAAFVVV